jgi:acyl-CoA synthetase (AMP-forming)/AMP-acid ligase II
MEISTAYAQYSNAFTGGAYLDKPFIHYYGFRSDKEIVKESLTRQAFLSLARKACAVLERHNCLAGQYVINCFSKNHYSDLAFRFAATMLGSIPATVNWQADTAERVCYKIGLVGPKLILTDRSFDPAILAEIRKKFTNIPVYYVENLGVETESTTLYSDLTLDDTRIVIFTSGTTGEPKGVQLPYRAYETNRKTFEVLLNIHDHDRFAVLIVNPLHHTNSTAIIDWAMRRPGSEIHLVEKYSTKYWEVITQAAAENYDRLVVPTVSRHFDFLESLKTENKLPVDLDLLRASLDRVDLLIGSAPVGPGTIKKLSTYTKHIPTIRFGSTETCLQVMGIPYALDDQQRLNALQRGWSHVYNGEPKSGYYIGRPTAPYTACRIVQSITKTDDNYMVDCEAGEPGYLITRGDNLMSAYLKNEMATQESMDGEWYLNLKDICFYLPNENGESDYYWLSRDSFMLIKGGSNYSYDQINMELKAFAQKRYSLPKTAIDIAVVGLNLDSEHEDSCCAIIELDSTVPETKREEMSKSFIAEARMAVSKGAKPDYILFAKVPRNFKGAFMVKEAEILFANILGAPNRSIL